MTTSRSVWETLLICCTSLTIQEGALPHPDLLQTVDEGDSLLSPSILWVLSTVLPSVYVPPSKLTGDNKAILGSHLPLVSSRPFPTFSSSTQLSFPYPRYLILTSNVPLFFQVSNSPIPAVRFPNPIVNFPIQCPFS